MADAADSSPESAPPDGATEKLTPAAMQGLLAAGAAGVTRELRAWQPPSVADLQKLLPQYEITAFIARGGMGAVYKGVQRSLERTVAIKILPPDITDDGEANYAQRFKQEARAMAKFKHPGIVTVYEAGEVELGRTLDIGRALGPPSAAGGDSRRLEDQPPYPAAEVPLDGGLGTSRPTLLYFVMEFIEGTDVAHLVAAQGQLPPQEAIRITTAVCDALAYAHARGVVHRDIKPSNIMIDADGQVKVADFGLAKITAQDSGGLTRSSVAMGTPDFVAPEAMLAGTLVDQRADIYAVGVMLYQMLTGHIPRGRFSPISAVVPQSDPKLDAIVDKAMQTDREKRYSSAVEMKTEVESVCRASVPDATAGKPSHRDGLQSRHRAPLLIAAAVIVLGVGAWMMWKKQTEEGRAAGPPAAANGSAAASEITPFQPPPGPPGLAKTYDLRNIINMALVQGDRRVLILEKDNMRLFDLATEQAVWQRSGVHQSGRVYDLADGQRAIRFGRTNDEFHASVMDLTTGNDLGSWSTANPFKGPSNNTSAVSPDGRHFCVAAQTSPKPGAPSESATHVWVLAADTMKTVVEWHLPSYPQLYTAAWLDAQRFLVSTSRPEALLTFDLRSTAAKPLPHPARLHNFIGTDAAGQFLAGAHLGNLALVPLAGHQNKPTVLRQPFGPRDISFAGSETLVVLGLDASDLHVYDLPSRAAAAEFHRPNENGTLLVSRDGSFAITKEIQQQGNEKITQLNLWRLPKAGAAKGGAAAPPAAAKGPTGTSAATAALGGASALPSSATKDAHFTNSLGMKFMPVPGTDVLFCIHETRKKDYAAYAAETPGVDMTWKQPSIYHGLPVGAGEDHPVTQINLADCQGFCAWLSAREGRRYRLPTDLEWSWAVGIGDREDASALPEKRGGGAGNVYAWGTEWPPPPRVANIADESLRQVAAHMPNRLIPTYEDGFATTAPVMSFPPNALGIYDLAGNVWELIPDWMDAEKQDVLRRGSSFNNGSLDPARAYVAASVRNRRNPHARSEDGGFRVVVEKP